jgi:hypothetical protein
MIDLFFIAFIAGLLLALWSLWLRMPAPVGYCRWCERVIYEPYCVHYESCEPYNEALSREIVRSRAVYRERISNHIDMEV